MVILKNIQPDIIKEYQDEKLNYVDSLNKGDILLLQNPTNESKARFGTINRCSISFIKQKLRPDSDNDIVWNFCRNIGPKQALKVIDAINMYTNQVEIQAKLTKNRNKNIFEYQKIDKDEIVEDNYAQIISYLIYTAQDELIWGDLTDTQKKLYLSSVINNKQLDNIIKSRMIDYISNYTTLNELKDLYKGNYKVLNRFIKK